jgi:hypothetical protein
MSENKDVWLPELKVGDKVKYRLSDTSDDRVGTVHRLDDKRVVVADVLAIEWKRSPAYILKIVKDAATQTNQRDTQSQS